MNKSTMIISSIITAGVAGFTSYMMMNKKARMCAQEMINDAIDDAGNYFKNMQN